MNSSILRALSVVVCFACFVGCSQHKKSDNQQIDQIKRSYRIDSLNDFLMDNLRSKRIVMLGDAYHENGYYMRLVTGVLDEWLDRLEKEKNNSLSRGAGQKEDRPLSPLPKKLILFVEADSERVDTMKHCMQTGDISNWLMFQLRGESKWGSMIGGTSVDNFEFFKNLKRIEDRVEKLQKQDPSNSYDFRILGPESIPPYDLIRTKDSSLWRERVRQFQEARSEYFVHQRDERSSATIRKVLDEHPDYKALIFYGTAHLLRGLQNKAREGGPKGVDTAYGYYLASYLDKYFSRDSVSVFFTVHVPGWQKGVIREFERTAVSADYRVFCVPAPPLQCPLGMVNCQNLLRAYNELMRQNSLGDSEEEQMYSQGYAIRLSNQLRRSYLFSRPEFRPWLDSLRHYAWDTSRIVNRKRIEIANRLIKSFDAIQNINSLETWIAKPLKDSAWYLPMLKMVLANLPPQAMPLGIDQLENLSLNEDTKPMIITRKEELVEYLLVNLLWVGTPDEQNRARTELTAKTGMKLKDEREWSDWWRTKYN